MSQTSTRIVHAEITPGLTRSPDDWMNPACKSRAGEGLCRVTATLEDGRRETVMQYHGELHFTPGQSVGLSSDEVAALYFAVDEAFLLTYPRAAGSRMAEMVSGTGRAEPMPF